MSGPMGTLDSECRRELIAFPKRTLILPGLGLLFPFQVGPDADLGHVRRRRLRQYRAAAQLMLAEYEQEGRLEQQVA